MRRVSLLLGGGCRRLLSSLPAAQLFVSRLCPTTSAEDLRNAFERVCSVSEVAIVSGARAVVTLGVGEEPLKALEALDGHPLNDSRLRVTLSRVREQRLSLEAKKLQQAIKNASSADEMQALLTGEVEPAHLATALSQLGHSREAGGIFVEALVQKVLASLKREEWSGSALSQAALGASRCGVTDEVFYSAIAQQAEPLLMQPESLTALACGLKGRSPDLMSRIAAAASGRVDDFRVPDLLHLALALAPTCGDSKFFEDCARFVMKRVTRLTSEELQLALEVFTQAGFSPSAAPSLFRAIQKECLRRDSLSPRGMVTITRLFASFGDDDDDEPGQLQLRLARTVTTTPESFSPADLSLAALALSGRGHEFQGLKNVIGPAYRAIENEALFKMRHEKWPPQSLSLIAHSFALRRLLAEDLFAEIANKAAEQIEVFEPADVAMIAKSFASVGFSSPPLFAALAQRATRCMGRFDGRSLVHLLWAVAVAGGSRSLQEFFLDDLFDAAAVRLPEVTGDLTAPEAQMLRIVLLFLQKQAPSHDLARYLAPFQSRLDAAAQRNHKENNDEDPSRTHLKNALQRLGWQTSNILAEGFFVDGAITERRLAVSMLTASDYLMDLKTSDMPRVTRILDGKALARRALLAEAQWEVLEIPYYEWDSLDEDDPQSHFEYLQSRIAPASPGSFLRSMF